MVTTGTLKLKGRRYAGFRFGILLEDLTATDPVTGAETWTPRDLTGYTARMQARRHRQQDAELLLTMDSDTGAITVDDAGNVTGYLPDTLTGLVPAGRWAYDLRIVPPGDDADYIIEGPLIWEESVTTP